MEDLKKILACLKPREVDFVNAYYEKKPKSSKKLALLKLLIKDPGINNDKASRILYSKPPDSSISQLKKRLKEDLIHFITFHTSEFTDKRKKAEFECKNALIQAESLASRGLEETAIEILQEASGKCRLFEFQVLHCIIQDRLKEIRMFREDLYSKPLTDELDFNGQNYNRFQVHFSQKQLALSLSFDNVKTRPVSFSEAKVNKLKDNCRESSSIRDYFWYYWGSIQYYLVKRDSDALLKAVDEIMKMIKSHHLLFSLEEKAIAINHCARISIFLNNYEMAGEYAKFAYEIFNESGKDGVSALETLMYSCFKRKDTESMNDIIRLAHTRNTADNQLKIVKWKYFEANQAFLQGNYHHSLYCLSQNSLIKEMVEWDLCHRLLEIYNIIEIKEYNWLEYKLENLRKLLHRLDHASLYLYRAKYQILKTLLRYDFDFNKTKTKEIHHFNDLSQNIQFPFGYELITFSDWFQSHYGELCEVKSN